MLDSALGTRRCDSRLRRERARNTASGDASFAGQAHCGRDLRGISRSFYKRGHTIDEVIRSMSNSTEKSARPRR